jgi:hypothetical protein
MVYDITDPNDVQFVDYKNSRDNTQYAGDNGAGRRHFTSQPQIAPTATPTSSPPTN